MQPKIQQFNLHGLKINARIWGDNNGHPVLGMHGWLDNAATFDLVAPYLKDIYLVSVDFPGHGHSGHLPEYVTYNNHERIMQMLMVVDLLGWEKYSILGHSMGGFLGLIMSAIDSKRVEKVVSIDAFNFMFEDESEIINQYRKIYHTLSHSYPAHSVYKSYEQAAKIRATVNNVMPLKYESALILANSGMEEVSGGCSWTFDLRLLRRTPTLLTPNQAKNILKSIEAEVCLILGHDGLKKIMPEIDSNLDLVKKIQVHEMPGGHHLHLDTPKPVGELVANFLI